MPSRFFCWFCALVFLVGLSGCGGSSEEGASAQPAPDPESAPGQEEPPSPSPSDIVVLRGTDPSVKTTGTFVRIDGGPLAESAQVLQSTGDGAARAVFEVSVPRTGYYDVSVRWPKPSSEPAAVAVSVYHRFGVVDAAVLDQGTSIGEWNSIGVFPFEAGGDDTIALIKIGASTLVVDAIRLHWEGNTAPVLEQAEATLPVGQVDDAYSGQLSAHGGVTPYRWSATRGELPPGLALEASSGKLTGTPSAAGVFTPIVEVRDAAGAVADAVVRIEILAAPDPVPEDPSPDLRELSEIVRTMPEGEWKKVNLNEFSSAWPPLDLRPGYYGNPAAIIRAWSSFAWDSKRGNLILYGGGHANYSGNDVYFWRGSTRKWERASLPSAIRQDSVGHWHAVDGPYNAPASAHTYDNSIYLPIIDRFLTLGGAAFNNGWNYVLEDGAGRTGPYLFDPNRADPMKVGGTTGSHIQRGGAHPEVVGGRMWQNRDAFRNGRLVMPSGYSFINACTAYAQENGKDVVYIRQTYALYRYTLHELSDPTKDTWEKVGTYWDGPGNQVACGYDAVRRLFVRTAINDVPFVYWNLNTPGASNRDQTVVPLDASGEFAQMLSSGTTSIRNCGFDFDPTRARFVLWCGGGQVWMLQPPATISREGWTIEKQRTPRQAVPGADVGTGILGKWKYAPNLDAFVALQDPNAGNVWIYKPVGWRNPSP